MHFSNISKVYFQKYYLYWHYAVLIFTSKLHDPPPPQTILPPSPNQNKNFWPPTPSKDFPEIFNPPPPAPQAGGRGGGVNALKRPTMLYEVVKVICKVKMFYSSLGVSKVFYSSTML